MAQVFPTFPGCTFVCPTVSSILVTGAAPRCRSAPFRLWIVVQVALLICCLLRSCRCPVRRCPGHLNKPLARNIQSSLISSLLPWNCVPRAVPAARACSRASATKSHFTAFYLRLAGPAEKRAIRDLLDSPYDTLDLIIRIMAQHQKRTLFNPFPRAVYLNRGGYGHIFRFANTAIVVKIPHRIVNGNAAEEARAAESLAILQQERAVYEALATKSQHPNIIHYFLSTDIAIFMRFEPDTLEQRLCRQTAAPIPEERQFRWAKEIASAASWLESLDYFHGDLRPENILLDEAEHVKLCDFGRTQKRGCKIEVATYPFYRPAKDAVAGPAHEQFAIGSCIYTIRTGEVPYGQWATPEEFKAMYEVLVRGEYPSTENDSVLGPVVSACWHSSYGSMKDVEADIELAVGMLCEEGSADTCLSAEEHDVCVQRCQEFLAQKGQDHRGKDRA